MATLNETQALLTNAHLLNRIEGAIIKSAVDVSNEASSVAYHSLRYGWAKKVLANDTSSLDETKRAIGLILQNVTIADQYQANPADGGTIVDINITDELANHINFLAGADDQP